MHTEPRAGRALRARRTTHAPRTHFAAAPALLLAGLVAACSGDGRTDMASGGNSPTGPSNQPTPVSLTMGAASAQPLQAVTVTFPSRAGAAGATLTGTFAQKSVNILLADSVSGSFLVPSVSAGSYSLTVDFGNKLRGTATLTVTAPPPIADAKATVTTAVTTSTAKLDSIVAQARSAPAGSTPLSAADADFLAAKSTALKTALASATQADLDEFARFLAANPGVLPANTSAAAVLAPADVLPFGNPAAISISELSQQVDAFIAAYSAKKTQVVLTIAGCVVGVTATGWTGIVAALVGSGCAVSIGWQAANIADLMKQQIGSLYAIPAKFEFIESAAIAASPVRVAAGGASRASSIGGASAPSFLYMQPGVSTHFGVQMHFRSFTSSDRGVLGGLFAAADEVAAKVRSVAQYIPGYNPPDFLPPASSREIVSSVPGSDLTVTVSGCTVAPASDGVNITCPQVSSADVPVQVSVSYSSRFGSNSASFAATVARTWAAVGTPQLTYHGTFREYANPSDPNSYTRRGCYYSVVLPVSGNTPVKFGAWTAQWLPPRTHTESGVSSSAPVDPRVYDGIVWLDRQLFWDAFPHDQDYAFQVKETVNWTIPATGQTGTTEFTLDCR
ncbi:MAG: hypothetical protein U9Q74_16025 [Gemmatimonadota bacterium]|nr:hypothetical protein [Gemmatimonadota bacterium]